LSELLEAASSIASTKTNPQSDSLSSLPNHTANSACSTNVQQPCRIHGFESSSAAKLLSGTSTEASTPEDEAQSNILEITMENQLSSECMYLCVYVCTVCVQCVCVCVCVRVCVYSVCVCTVCVCAVCV